MVEKLSQDKVDAEFEKMVGEVVDQTSDTESDEARQMYETLIKLGYTEEEIMAMLGFEGDTDEV